MENVNLKFTKTEVLGFINAHLGKDFLKMFDGEYFIPQNIYKVSGIKEPIFDNLKDIL